MFTGIIEEVGRVTGIVRSAKSSILQISGSAVLNGVKIGDSIAVNGVCLTVTSFSKTSFRADVMNETMIRSSLGLLRLSSPVNLERAMPANGRFGGHLVSGHIDGTGTIAMIERDDNAIWFTVEAPSSLMKYIVEKGSIAIDGISLTVAKVTPSSFRVSVIPHTAKETALTQKTTGDAVNLENDMVGKYIERFLTFYETEKKPACVMTKEFLARAGYG